MDFLTKSAKKIINGTKKVYPTHTANEQWNKTRKIYPYESPKISPKLNLSITAKTVRAMSPQTARLALALASAIDNDKKKEETIWYKGGKNRNMKPMRTVNRKTQRRK